MQATFPSSHNSSSYGQQVQMLPAVQSPAEAAGQGGASSSQAANPARLPQGLTEEGYKAIRERFMQIRELLKLPRKEGPIEELLEGIEAKTKSCRKLDWGKANEEMCYDRFKKLAQKMQLAGENFDWNTLSTFPLLKAWLIEKIREKRERMTGPIDSEASFVQREAEDGASISEPLVKKFLVAMETQVGLPVKKFKTIYVHFSTGELSGLRVSCDDLVSRYEYLANHIQGCLTMDNEDAMTDWMCNSLGPIYHQQLKMLARELGLEKSTFKSLCNEQFGFLIVSKFLSL